MYRAFTPGQFLALDQLERGAAAGREVGDAVGEPELGQRRRGVAAADDRGRLGRGHRLGDGPGPGRERLELERAHRAVPEHGAGGRDRRAVALRGARADVEAHPAVGHVDAVERLDLGVGAERAAGDEVGRQLELRRRRAACRRGLDARLLAQRGADVVALGLEEREAHRAADQDRVRASRGTPRARRSCPSPSRRRRPPPAAASGPRGCR